jgi:hypothetical protein
MTDDTSTQLALNTIRTLSIDAVQQAKSEGRISKPVLSDAEGSETNERFNSKSESGIEKTSWFGMCSFDHLNLFRISCFEFRISVRRKYDDSSQKRSSSRFPPAQ